MYETFILFRVGKKPCFFNQKPLVHLKKTKRHWFICFFLLFFTGFNWSLLVLIGFKCFLLVFMQFYSF